MATERTIDLFLKHVVLAITLRLEPLAARVAEP
jgi:hypothetical protein